MLVNICYKQPYSGRKKVSLTKFMCSVPQRKRLLLNYKRATAKEAPIKFHSHSCKFHVFLSITAIREIDSYLCCDLQTYMCQNIYNQVIIPRKQLSIE